MADQAERVILEAEDQVTPIVGKANSALGSFEGKAVSSHGNVIRITDQTRTSVQRLIASLEKQADVYGKSGVEKLVAQRDQLLQRYNKEPAAVDAITKSYTRMVAEQQKIESTAKFEGFGSKVQQFIQAPLQGAQGAITSVLTAMGPFGTALAAGAAVIGSVAVAGWESMKSLASFAIEVEHTALRMGLTTKEVAQFRFAAQYAGGDISSFEGAMRKLSTEVESGGKNLTAMGVAFRDVQSGALRDTKDVLIDLSERLNAMPNAFERNAAAVKVLGRAGLEVLPELLELPEGLKRAEELQKNYSADDLARFKDYQHEVAEIESAWESLKRSMAKPLAAVVSVGIEAVSKGSWKSWLAAMTGNVAPLVQDMAGQSPDFKPMGPDAPASISAQGAARIASGNSLIDSVLGSTDEERLAKAKETLTGLRKELEDLKGTYPEASAAKRADVAAEEGVVKGLEAEVAARKKLKDLSSFTITDKARSEMEASAPVIGAPPSLYPRTPELASANALGGWTPEFTVNQAEMDKANAPMRAAQTAQMGARFKGEDEQRKQAQQEKLSGIAAEASATERLLELRKGPDGELETAKKVAGIRQEALQQELAVTGDIGKYREESLKNGLDLQVKMAEEQQKQVTAADDAQKQRIDSLASTSSGLFHTLFTKPQDFGKQLFGTIKEAALKPITGGLGDLVGNAVFGGKKDPVTVATDQNTSATMQNSTFLAGLTAVLAAATGVAAPSVSGGGASGVPSVSMPAIMRSVSSAAPPSMPSVWNTALRSISMGGGEAGSPVSSDISAGSGPEAMSRAAGGSNPLGALAQIFGGGKGPSAGGFGGIGKMLGGLKGANWGGFNRSGAVYGAGTGNDAGEGASSAGHISGVNGMAGAALMAGGTMLAQQGLLGSSRGTGLGIAEGAVGGAAMGFGIAGPIGALVGGVVGFGIGVGEKLAGVKSPEQKAHDDIAQIYGVNIPTGSGSIKQVVSIAQSQYGGDVSVAVRSPSVRQLVMLYSEATGQKTVLSGSTPYAGSFAESGGNLYQQATYQDGHANVFGSNIPTLGGIAAANYPAPGGPNTSGGSGGTSFAININGQPISPEFVADQAMAAQGASYNRTQQAANMQVPGLMVA